MKLCAVTILYNPDEAFISYLQTYAQFVDKIFIIDNSESGVVSFESRLIDQYAGRINYISNKANLGIATSLNMACKLASDEGFEWILTMDQDSYFDDRSFWDISAPVMKDKSVGIIAAAYFGKVPFKKEYSAFFYQAHFVVTSGNFVNINSWQVCGGFEDKLFIDEVDNDFCMKLKNKGFLVLMSKDIFLKHKLGLSFSISLPFSKRQKSIGIHKPWRMYFTVRNGLYVSFRYGVQYPSVFFERMKHLAIKLLLIIFYYPDKKKYLGFYMRGVKDFFLKRYHNKKIWQE